MSRLKSHIRGEIHLRNRVTITTALAMRGGEYGRKRAYLTMLPRAY